MKPADYLEAAEVAEKATQKLEQGWCQHDVAQNAEGQPVLIDDPNACQWCAFGAIKAAAYQKDYMDIGFIIQAACDYNIVAFNDTEGRTQEEVVSLMRETANRLRQLAQTVTQ